MCYHWIQQTILIDDAIRNNGFFLKCLRSSLDSEEHLNNLILFGLHCNHYRNDSSTPTLDDSSLQFKFWTKGQFFYWPIAPKYRFAFFAFQSNRPNWKPVDQQKLRWKSTCIFRSHNVLVYSSESALLMLNSFQANGNLQFFSDAF